MGKGVSYLLIRIYLKNLSLCDLSNSGIRNIGLSSYFIVEQITTVLCTASVKWIFNYFMGLWYQKTTWVKAWIDIQQVIGA